MLWQRQFSRTSRKNLPRFYSHWWRQYMSACPVSCRLLTSSWWEKERQHIAVHVVFLFPEPTSAWRFSLCFVWKWVQLEQIQSLSDRWQRRVCCRTGDRDDFVVGQVTETILLSDRWTETILLSDRWTETIVLSDRWQRRFCCRIGDRDDFARAGRTDLLIRLLIVLICFCYTLSSLFAKQTDGIASHNLMVVSLDIAHWR